MKFNDFKICFGTPGTIEMTDEYDPYGFILIPYTWREFGVSEKESRAAANAGYIEYEDIVFWPVPAHEAIDSLNEHEEDLDDIKEDESAYSEDAFEKTEADVVRLKENLEFFRSAREWDAKELCVEQLDKFETEAACIKLNLLKKGAKDTPALEDDILEHFSEFSDKDRKGVGTNKSEILKTRKTFGAFRRPVEIFIDDQDKTIEDFDYYDTSYCWRPDTVSDPVPKNVYSARMKLLLPEDRVALMNVFNKRGIYPDGREGSYGANAKFAFFGGSDITELKYGEDTNVMKQCVEWCDNPETAARVFKASAVNDLNRMYSEKKELYDKKVDDFMKEAFSYKKRQNSVIVKRHTKATNVSQK